MKKCYCLWIKLICFLFVSIHSSILLGSDCRTIFGFVPGEEIGDAISRMSQPIEYSFPVELFEKTTTTIPITSIPITPILTEISESKWLDLPRTEYIKEYFGKSGAEKTEFYVKSLRDFGVLEGSKPARGYNIDTSEDIWKLNMKLGRDPYAPITEKLVRYNFDVLTEMDEEYKRRGMLPPPRIPLETVSFFNFKMSRKKVERMNMHMLLHVVRMDLEAVATRYRINKDTRSDRRIIEIISQILASSSLVKTFCDSYTLEGRSYQAHHSKIPVLNRELSRNDFLLENVENYVTGFDAQIKELVRIFNKEVGKNYVPKVEGYDEIEQATDEQLEVAFKRAIWSLGKAIYDRNPAVFEKKGGLSISKLRSLEGYAVAVSPSLLLTTKSTISNSQKEDITNVASRIGIQKEGRFIESVDVFGLSRDSEFVLVRFSEGTFENTSIVQLDCLKDATTGRLLSKFKEDPKGNYMTILGRGSISEKIFRGQFSTDIGKYVSTSTSYEGYPVSQEGRVVGLFAGDIQNPSFVMFSESEVSKIEELVTDEN